jgi:spore germination cell wall hydrolase CwlJ-like protein
MDSLDRFMHLAVRVFAVITMAAISLVLLGVNPSSFYIAYSNQANVLPTPVILQPEGIETILPEETDFVEYSEDDLFCLQQNIFFEARNQSVEAMQAVALVTMNRVASKFYPDTICDVVFQGRMSDGKRLKNQCQFSWTCDGKPDIPSLKNKKELIAWNTAHTIAVEVLSGNVENFLGKNVTHYHASYVSPNWSKARRYVRVASIQRHVFYKDKRETI